MEFEHAALVNKTVIILIKVLKEKNLLYYSRDSH